MPDPDDLRGLARGLRNVVDLARSALNNESEPSAVGRRIMTHLGCDLADVVPVTERFPLWEHVNVQRGVDAYLAAHGRRGVDRPGRRVEPTAREPARPRPFFLGVPAERRQLRDRPDRA